MSACMRTAREFMREEDAVGVVEIILILVVLISLVMLLAAACSGVLLLVFRKSRKTEIPLVPFLLLGYVGGMVI